MLVYLVRHAIADGRDPDRWPDDRDRPLTEEGRRRFRSAAKGLRKLAEAPDLVLTSPYLRARQTAALLHEHARWPEPVAHDALGAEQSAAGMLAVLEAQQQRAAVALVGHEPTLSELASGLLCGDPVRVTIELKKGAVACLRVHATLAGRAELLWLLPPRVLRELAR
jgi:phosphohistidine phosphatase